MAIILYLHTGHGYRVADNLTLNQVNDALDSNPNRFVQVPLADNAAVGAGTPGQGEQILALYITPSSVSHFIVI